MKTKKINVFVLNDISNIVKKNFIGKEVDKIFIRRYKNNKFVNILYKNEKENLIKESFYVKDAFIRSRTISSCITKQEFYFKDETEKLFYDENSWYYNFSRNIISELFLNEK